MTFSSFSPDISVVIPVYGCEKILYSLYERLYLVFHELDVSYEIILVHDGATAKSWRIIAELSETDKRVRGIKLSRNYGQHYAITAGVDYCLGNWLVVMDCDLQDKPEEIFKFWKKAQEGFDIVIGRRHDRHDSLMKRTGSKLFYKFFGYMTDQKTDAAQSNYGIYSRKVVEELKRLPEYSRCFPLLIRWLGFDTVAVDIEHSQRAEGESTYTLGRLISLAVDVIVSYSNKPLKLFIQAGFLISLISTCFALGLILRFFIFAQPVQGWTSVMVSIFFLSGINLLGLGVLGVYIGRIFNQVKGRPLYVIDQITPLQEQTEAP